MGKKQFLNSMYKAPVTAYDDRGKRAELCPDFLLFTLCDADSNERTLHIMERPVIDFYIAKANQPFHRISIPEDEARRISVPYKDRNKEMAAALNLLNEYYNSWKNGSNYLFMNSLKKHPNLYAADTNIEDFYKTKVILKNGYVFAPMYKKGYADIEVDLSNYKEDFAYPDIAPCPVYLITYIDRASKEAFSFILYDERIKDDILRIVNNPDSFIQRNLPERILKENFKYHFNVYRTELALLKGFFSAVHNYKPDFVGWWNMPFDMPYILKRFEVLGCSEREIADICCHPEVPEKYRYVRYIEDPKRKQFNYRRHEGEDEEEAEYEETPSPKSKGKPHPSRLIDWVEIPGYTQFFDQLSAFSCLRKRSLLRSYALDNIGKKYGGIGKLNLAEAGYNIRNINIANFEVCLAYNIEDTYVQYAIEEKQHDINQMVASSFNTRLSKTFSNSIVIKNYLMRDLYTDSKQIMGNAVSFNTKESFEGALVGRPELIEQLGIDIMGKPSYVFENAIDLDATSLYPSIIITHNIFKSALFGRIMNIKRPDGSSMGKGEDLFESLQTLDQSIFEAARTYLGLPSVQDLLAGMERQAHLKAANRAAGTAAAR
jgi:DNA polymerase elongation subunit (family B)